MLNVGQIHEGYVIDHIKAGMSFTLYKYLKLDKSEFTIAIIKNAQSNKLGKKDILKIQCPIGAIDLDILGFVDHTLTVNVIQGGHIIEKKKLTMPKQITNVIKCKNPRCITSIEQELDQVFVLTDPEKAVYRCKYCETKYNKNGDHSIV